VAGELAFLDEACGEDVLAGTAAELEVLAGAGLGRAEGDPMGSGPDWEGTLKPWPS